MADNNPLTEPLWFVLPFGSAPIHASPDKRQALNHALGLKQLTSICISQPSVPHSIAAQQMNKVAGFKIQQGLDHLVELSFDEAQAGLSHDFKPALPLIIYW
ncbi:hypothetical protein [Thiolinea disciformis]|uniref:hypothetical protein n=1 Tax=Thiolinea disciformis TaxID=125614 RepID=UPI000368F46E|nr:hypothetical protein [Thiolinea disciformis]